MPGYSQAPACARLFQGGFQPIQGVSGLGRFSVRASSVTSRKGKDPSLSSARPSIAELETLRTADGVWVYPPPSRVRSQLTGRKKPRISSECAVARAHTRPFFPQATHAQPSRQTSLLVPFLTAQCQPVTRHRGPLTAPLRSAAAARLEPHGSPPTRWASRSCGQQALDANLHMGRHTPYRQPCNLPLNVFTLSCSVSIRMPLPPSPHPFLTGSV